MNKVELEQYYFPTERTKRIKKYLPKIIKYLGKNFCFVDENLSDDERVKIQSKMEAQIQLFFKQNINIFIELSYGYQLKSFVFLAEITLQVLCAYKLLQSKNNYDIFLSPKSILFFNNECPPNIKEWLNNKELTILDFCKIYEILEKNLNNRH